MAASAFASSRGGGRGRGVKRKEISIDGYFKSKDDSHLPTIAQVWDFALTTYENTERDKVYAYLGPDNFVRINKLYSSSFRKCRFVLLINSHHEFLQNYLEEAERFAQHYDLIILSLTIFGTEQHDVTSALLRAAERREFERELAKLEIAANEEDDDDAAAEEYYAYAAAEDDTVGSDTVTASSVIANCDQPQQALPPPPPPPPPLPVENDVELIDEEEEELREKWDDDITLESIATVRPTALDIGGSDRINNYMHNSVLARFFAELLMYIRAIPICDKTGVISHKSFRLIHSRTLDRWYRELISTCMENSPMTEN